MGDFSIELEHSKDAMSVLDGFDAGVSGYEAEYRIKGDVEWTQVRFEAGRSETSISGLAPGEYEVHVRGFVDNTGASVPDEYRAVEYGVWGDILQIMIQ